MPGRSHRYMVSRILDEDLRLGFKAQYRTPMIITPIIDATHDLRKHFQERYFCPNTPPKAGLVSGSLVEVSPPSSFEYLSQQCFGVLAISWYGKLIHHERKLWPFCSSMTHRMIACSSGPT